MITTMVMVMVMSMGKGMGISVVNTNRTLLSMPYQSPEYQTSTIPLSYPALHYPTLPCVAL
jgi:hypothetical protein